MPQFTDSELLQQLREVKRQVAADATSLPTTILCAGCQLARVEEQRDSALGFQKQAGADLHEMVHLAIHSRCTFSANNYERLAQVPPAEAASFHLLSR